MEGHVVAASFNYYFEYNQSLTKMSKNIERNFNREYDLAIVSRAFGVLL